MVIPGGLAPTGDIIHWKVEPFLRPWSILLTCVVVSVSAQVFLKLGVQAIGGVSLAPGAAWASMVRVATCPWIWVGLVTYASGFYLWLAVLSKFSFHEANLYFSINKIVMLILAVYLFGETITRTRYIGAAMIIAGAILISTSSSPQAAESPAPDARPVEGSPAPP